MDSGASATTVGPIQVETIDNVPVLWIESAPPPFLAMLVMRVGQADEDLPHSGITHFVEHLAFPHRHDDQVGFNGVTELTRTTFMAWGDPLEAADFLHRISVTLGRLPVARMETDRSIILAEEERGGGNPHAELLLARYGAVGPGITAFRQLGIRHLREDDVTAWAARYFTSANAVLCLTGPPPPRLRLELPDGERRVAPPVTALDGPLPRWRHNSLPQIALGVTTGFDVASGTAARILERRLYERLRHDLGASYAVQGAASLIDATHMHRAIVADCRAESATQVTSELLRLATELAEKGPTADDLARDYRQFERQLRDDPRAVLGWMFHAAECYLNGIDVDEFEDYLAARADLTTSEVRGAWQDAWRRAIVLPPETVDITDAAFGTLELPSPVVGRSFAPAGIRRLRDKTRATLGPDGITLSVPDGRVGTVRFDDCVAMAIRPDDERTLFARRGSTVSVSAQDFANGEELIAALDHAIPRTLWIDLTR